MSMLRLTIRELAEVVGGETWGDDVGFEGVSTDTRSIQRGQLFVAVRGKRYDGHNFVKAAFDAGAAGAMVADKSVLTEGSPAVVVDDTRGGLARLATYHRARLGLKAVAVTGSNGKTTTKELLGRLLGIKYRTSWARNSYNNDIGVALTVLGLDYEDEAAVFELEMNQLGGTLALAKVCQPQVGVVTNIHDTHLEFMSSRTGVAAEKAELLQALPGNGTAVLNYDDPLVREIGHRSAVRRQVWFGLDRRADVFATEVVNHGVGGVSFRLNDEFPVTLVLAGLHNVSNCLAACAAAAAMGIDLAAMPPVIGRFKPVPLRLRVFRLSGVTLIDDSYNANPQSVRAGLEVLRHSGQKRHRVAILGDMMELGRDSVFFHREIGRLVQDVCDRLGAVGELAAVMADAAVEAGMAPDSVVRWSAAGEVGQELFDLFVPGDTILLKGSRAVGLEALGRRIVSHYGEETNQIY